MSKTIDYKKQGKRNKLAGARFEKKVRDNLVKDGWIVSKWQNNVKLSDGYHHGVLPNWFGECVPAKPGRFRLMQTGFPDFICYKQKKPFSKEYFVWFVEVKSNGYLSKEEKDKARWYLDNFYCSKFLIALKGKKRGEIKYIEFTK